MTSTKGMGLTVLSMSHDLSEEYSIPIENGKYNEIQ